MSRSLTSWVSTETQADESSRAEQLCSVCGDEYKTRNNFSSLGTSINTADTSNGPSTGPHLQQICMRNKNSSVESLSVKSSLTTSKLENVSTQENKLVCQFWIFVRVCHHHDTHIPSHSTAQTGQVWCLMCLRVLLVSCVSLSFSAASIWR